MKLFKIILKGMTGWSASTIYGMSYVVAKDPTSAYEIVRSYLDTGQLGFRSERVLSSIELLAECGDYPECKTILFIQDGQ